MFCSQKNTENTVIGEAAINVALREEEITVETLLDELNAMLLVEKNSSRKRIIKSGLNWLKHYRKLGMSSSEDPLWMLPSADCNSLRGEGVIRLNADED